MSVWLPSLHDKTRCTCAQTHVPLYTYIYIFQENSPSRYIQMCLFLLLCAPASHICHLLLLASQMSPYNVCIRVLDIPVLWIRGMYTLVLVTWFAYKCDGTQLDPVSSERKCSTFHTHPAVGLSEGTPEESVRRLPSPYHRSQSRKWLSRLPIVGRSV